MLLAAVPADSQIRRVDLARRIAQAQQPEQALECLAEPLFDGACQQFCGAGRALPDRGMAPAPQFSSK